MQLTHKIELCPTKEQAVYFKQAAGCARFVWNWALEHWNLLYNAGQKPNAMALKKSFNAIKYTEFPWIKDIHRDAHAQPFAHLAKAWSRFFEQIKTGEEAHSPTFKKRGKCRDSFYIANDKFSLQDNIIKLPRIGKVKMTETLRFSGKILGATVSRTADRWFAAIQVDVPDNEAKKQRMQNNITGIDLGLKAAVTLSDGQSIPAPKPLKRALRRLKIRGRCHSRKIECARKAAGIEKPIPKGTRLPVSNNRKKSAEDLARFHARICNLRKDFTHKLTTQLVRENQAIGIEDLHVKGMLKNDRLSRAISDVGFGEIRRQLCYKAKRYDTEVIVADRWYPSSKTCSHCGHVLKMLLLSTRDWDCPECNTYHDRDHNAAKNLQQLATAAIAGKALPVANRPVTEGTKIEMFLS